MREKAKNEYRELSNEEKNIKREYGRKRYHNISEEKKRISRKLLCSKKINIKNFWLFFLEDTLTFGEKCINKNKFHMHKKPISIDGIDTQKIVLSSKELYGNKYFIGYDDYNDGIIPLYVRLPPMNALTKYFKDSKYMNLLVYDKELFKKCNNME